MEKVLNQQEIDHMVRAARGGGLPAEPTVTRWDYRQAGRIGREQLESISALHEGFARSLTNSIGAYLRIGFQVGLISAEHLTYREFLSGVPERSYLGSCKLVPFGANALIQMDLAVAFPLIDVLLGGEGVGQDLCQRFRDWRARVDPRGTRRAGRTLPPDCGQGFQLRQAAMGRNAVDHNLE